MAGNRFRRIIPKLKTFDAGSMHSMMQHLAREQGFMETVFDTIQEAVIVTDDTRRILYHNAAAKAMLGVPDDLTHLTVDKLLKGANWDTMLSPETKILRQELEIFYPKRRVVQVYAKPLSSARMPEDENRFVVILTDITATVDKAHSDAESERSRLVSMLAAGVAHEIGNPLNSLYLHLQYLQRLVDRDDFDAEAAKEELDESRHEVERLDAIITQFLHALRPGKVQFQVVDLKELVVESLNFMRHEITEREVNVELIWSDDVPVVDGDNGQLKQVFYNLVRNALQAMPAGGKLKIQCSANDDFVSLSVTDSGKGIKKEDLARIFEAYFTTKRTGTGLGLMIVERIVREHGGSLSVDSDEGQGATFTISLPRRDRKVKSLPLPEEEKEN